MQVDDFHQGLDRLVTVKQDVADALRHVSHALTGSQQRTALQLANQVAAIKSREQFLSDSNLATFALCLIIESSDSASADSNPSKAQINSAIERWMGTESIRGNQMPTLVGPSMAPLAVLWLALTVMSLIAIFLVPMFQRMFNEFGLSLPTPTLALFAMSDFLRGGGWILLLFALLGSTAWQFWRWQQRVGLASARQTLAEWAWHCAMVSDTGATAQQTVAVVSQLPWPVWLQKFTGYLLELYRNGQDPFEQLREIRDHRCDLLAGAMQLSPPNQRGATLRVVAGMYANLPDQKVHWWSMWGVHLATLAIGFIVLVTVVSLYMPLVELISGLS